MSHHPPILVLTQAQPQPDPSPAAESWRTVQQHLIKHDKDIFQDVADDINTLLTFVRAMIGVHSKF